MNTLNDILNNSGMEVLDFARALKLGKRSLERMCNGTMEVHGPILERAVQIEQDLAWYKAVFRENPTSWEVISHAYNNALDSSSEPL